MVHLTTHNKVAAYVLNTSVKRLPPDPKFSPEQQNELESLESEVSKCAKNILDGLKSKSSFTLKPHDYSKLFSVVFNAYGLDLIFTEMLALGVKLDELDEKSKKVKYGPFRIEEYELVPKKEELEEVKEK